MIQLFMSRNGSSAIVPLQFPASQSAITEASRQLDEANREGKTKIVEIKSVIANLPSYLSRLDPDSRTQLAQLNRLSSKIKSMRLISEMIGFGPMPAPDREVEQRLTLNSRGKIWFSNYLYGDWVKQKLHRKEPLRAAVRNLICHHSVLLCLIPQEYHPPRLIAKQPALCHIL